MFGSTDLSFLWPRLLWSLAALPLLVLIYLWLTTRRARTSGPLAYLEHTDGAQARTLGARWRRALPPLLWLLALGALLLALARPQAALLLPARMEAVVLAMDMSGSMRATDIEPTRLVAARNAAKAFVDEQPQHVRVGVVAVAAAAAVVQSPTRNREELTQAIERLEPQRGTALGSGLIIALDTLLPEAKIDVEQFINPRPGAKPRPRPADTEGKSADETTEPGSARAVAIVLLSDGVSNVGPDPLKAAEIAADYGVRIYTVGIGTPEGATVTADGWKARVRLDEAALQRVASLTGGQYFRASDAAQLTSIYRELGTRIGFERRQPTELTALVVALGALLATLGAALSFAWFNRIL
jgi:Ca-activated chloride channel family protein